MGGISKQDPFLLLSVLSRLIEIELSLPEMERNNIPVIFLENDANNPGNDKDDDAFSMVSINTPRTELRNRLFLVLPKFKSSLLWILCTLGSMVFSWGAIAEYFQNNPIIVTTTEDPPLIPDPVVVKICHPVFADPSKVLNANGSVYSNESYQFLRKVITGDNSFNFYEWAISYTHRDYFLLSERVLEEFKLDLETFMIGCVVSGHNRSCIDEFSMFLDPEGLCYSALLNFEGYGYQHGAIFVFYIDPSINFGAFTLSHRLPVIFEHPDSYSPINEGIMVKRQNQYTVSSATTHYKQKNSFEKSKCVHKTGSDIYSFTGRVSSNIYVLYDIARRRH